MGRRLSKYVHVPDETGITHAFGPNDEVPAWAADQITNPKAWADEETVSTPPALPAAAGGVQTGSAHQEMPPKAGPGSGADAWIAYARHLGLTVPDDAPRGDVIEAVEEHLAGS